MGVTEGVDVQNVDIRWRQEEILNELCTHSVSIIGSKDRDIRGF